MRHCIVIPNYNHIDGFKSLLTALAKYELPIIVVNDASSENVSAQLKALEQALSFTLLHHQQNQGKGGAVQTGLTYATEQGFDHALQVDADGQHDLSDIAAMLDMSKSYPDALISGAPLYDESIPKHRYYARYITHFWVCVETLSLQIKDTMCGFRVYPLAAFKKLSDSTTLGKRMDFDIEVMVRMYWQGCDIRFLPTKVIYPENGLSHFRPLEDNVKISWMHTRLCFGMLLRSPFLLARNIKRWATR